MNKRVFAAALVTVCAVGSYWYFSPYLAMRNIQQAAQKKDADAFNARVDYAKVRDSLKGQMSAMVAEQLGQSSNGAESFGSMLGLALVNQMVEAFVRPEVVMHAMQEGDLRPGPAKSSSSHPDQNSPDQNKIEWLFERHGVDKIIATGRRPDQPENTIGPGFVFERSGFADWKLTEIRLPPRT